MKALPEPARKQIFHSMKSPYSAITINAGAIDPVHARTLEALKPQLEVIAPRLVDPSGGLPALPRREDLAFVSRVRAAGFRYVAMPTTRATMAAPTVT